MRRSAKIANRSDFFSFSFSTHSWILVNLITNIKEELLYHIKETIFNLNFALRLVRSRKIQLAILRFTLVLCQFPILDKQVIKQLQLAKKKKKNYRTITLLVKEHAVNVYRENSNGHFDIHAGPLLLCLFPFLTNKL
jgi:hypothetical protein